jgi:8-oxo-dGTP diphosphatase
MLTVVAALIESDGKILVCQRRRGGPFALLWEFPGGKQEPGETPAESLRRELREELGVEAQIGAEIYRTRHQYAEMSHPIELIFFAATADPAQIQNHVFEQIQWCSSRALAGLNFLPADRDLIEKLATGTIRLDAPPSK